MKCFSTGLPGLQKDLHKLFRKGWIAEAHKLNMFEANGMPLEFLHYFKYAFKDSEPLTGLLEYDYDLTQSSPYWRPGNFNVNKVVTRYDHIVMMEPDTFFLSKQFVQVGRL